MTKECPTCGDEFTNTTGMKTHHAQVHGESLAGFEKECSYCGTEFHAMMRETEYCSQSCFGKDNAKGSDNPAWSGGKQNVTCEWCGGTYKVTPAKADTSRYCSTDCRTEAHSEHMSGTSNPNFKRATTECEYCGNTFQIQPHKLDSPHNNYCSSDCAYTYLSENRSGENHPRWKGGHSEDYGDNWREQREKCIQRDNAKCRDCGITRKQHIETFNADLHAHHVIPKRKFESPEAANDLGNLVALCKECHPKWEGVPVVPEKRE